MKEQLFSIYQNLGFEFDRDIYTDNVKIRYPNGECEIISGDKARELCDKWLLANRSLGYVVK